MAALPTPPPPPPNGSTTQQESDSNSSSGSAPGDPLHGWSGPSVSNYLPSLSAKTCLILLPKLDNDQLIEEIKYLKSTFPDWTPKRDLRSRESKLEVLRAHLTKTLFSQFEDTVDKFSSLLTEFSCAVSHATTVVKEAAGDTASRRRDGDHEPSSTDLPHAHTYSGTEQETDRSTTTVSYTHLTLPTIE